MNGGRRNASVAPVFAQFFAKKLIRIRRMFSARFLPEFSPFGGTDRRPPKTAKAPPEGGAFAYENWRNGDYNADSISKPQASKRASGMYLEFLFLRAHSRRRVDRIYWSGLSLNSLTICSKEVTVGTTGPMGSGLPQFGFPRRFAICFVVLNRGFVPVNPGQSYRGCCRSRREITFLFYGFLLQKSIAKLHMNMNIPSSASG